MITPSGLSLGGAMLGKSDFSKKCNRMSVSEKRSQPQIKNGDILLTYIGTEGFLVNCELRKGKQHCQKHTPEFLQETLALCHQLTDAPLLVRLDSSNDVAKIWAF